MSGEWVKGPHPSHQCKKPNLMGVAVGSVWRCDCGLAWRVHPGSYWLRAQEHDKEISPT